MKPNKNNPAPLAVEIVKPVKVPMLKTGDDAEVIEKFTELFREAQNGIRRIVAFGIYAEQVKFTKLKKNQFKNWIKGAFPDISYRSVAAHMQLATSAVKASGFKSLQAFFKSAAVLHIANSSELLLLPENKLSEEAKAMRGKICSVIDGKSARQLFAEFKQADEDEDNHEPKRGRLKGKGGASAAQRAAAKAKLDAGEIKAMEVWAEETSEIITEQADDANWGRMTDDKVIVTLLEAFQLGADYLKRLIAMRKSAKDGK